MNEDQVRGVEVALLVEGIKRVHGYDLSQYAKASLTRRIQHWLAHAGFDSFGLALSQLLRDPLLCHQLVQEVTVNVTEMFRDPQVFKALRSEAVPLLRTYPHVRVWIAGCASGEEVYSLAILLHEEGLIDQCRIYATDINERVLDQARQGTVPLKQMQRYTRNYQASGGKSAFSDYYVARYDRALFDAALLRNVVFAVHNLATDADFSEMHLIMCRNVMIYFEPLLKERVLRLFDSCLVPGGLLCLGTKESLEQRAIGPRYREVQPRSRIYHKQYGEGVPA